MDSLLMDKSLISDAVTTAAIASDDRDWARFRSLLADRVHFDASRHVGGPPTELAAEDFLAGPAAVLSGFDGTQHALSNMLVTVDGDEAQCRADMVAYHYITEDDGTLSHVTMRGRWELGLRRVTGRWLITRWAVIPTAPLDGDAGLYERAGARGASAA
ncbi:nuclear transport factor 2 family protein [Catenuloplanes indicus]|uniref:3-phenylpropionate/cinnamic acid dioxygenase small subunit n=1 Tax=Catenuloplanes indicus TaxID=137267 RepID=A0AAE4AVC4_9ACTN|nr:nuclear transport factor 2 family protein [Catenuloplanes indicus]MDQ0363586.1 3-phenylpropionate/cinnamic acid dioxygenase small subunit [Catenuloplanes indicus]